MDVKQLKECGYQQRMLRKPEKDGRNTVWVWITKA
jgi:hypothetical protein